MAGREKGPLTEPMYYVLMSFLSRGMCGTEVTEFVERKTAGRVRLGPGTLYAILGKFQEEELIRETWSQGRMRVYRITENGRALFRREMENMRRCVDDGQREMGEEEET